MHAPVSLQTWDIVILSENPNLHAHERKLSNLPVRMIRTIVPMLQ